MCRLVVDRAASVGWEVTDPGCGAEVETGGAVELDRTGIIADVENIAIAVVGQETSGAIGFDLRAAANPVR
jgi:hypothetical protein